MNQILAIAIGGAVGSVFRFWTSKGVQHIFGYMFPVGILAVNIIGSFAMGLLATIFLDRFHVDSLWTATILIGLLGGFTTFSSFSLDTLNLLESGAIIQALLYVGSSVIFSLIAAWLGVVLGRMV